MKLSSTFQFVEDFCTVGQKLYALLFPPHFNYSSNLFQIKVKQILEMYSDMKLSSTFQFVEDFCMVGKQLHAPLFLPHFNNSSTSVGYCKSLSHFSWANFNIVFRYEIIFHILLWGRFLYGWGKKYMLLFSFHISLILSPLSDIVNLFHI